MPFSACPSTKEHICSNNTTLGLVLYQHTDDMEENCFIFCQHNLP